MSLVTECIQKSLPIWEQCLQSEFIRTLCEGSLSEDCFKGYIADDSLYLREYARVFAYGMLHAKDMKELQLFYSLLSFVNEGENSTRLYYIHRYGLNDETVYTLTPRPESAAYINTMLDCAQNATSAAECIMAALPCMLSYGYLFVKIAKECPNIQHSPYARFINDYAGDAYITLCKEWIAAAEQACQNLTKEQAAICADVFCRCSEHELSFWEMSAKPRDDIEKT